MKKVVTLENKQNPRLCQRALNDGRISLYLEYYLGRSEEAVYDEDGNPVLYANGRQKYKVTHQRRKESLGLFLHAKPKNAEERNQNKECIIYANEVRRKREEELRADKLGYRLRVKGVNFLDFLDEYEKAYTKRDIRMIAAVISRFKAFLTEFYPHYDKVISPEKITVEMNEKFAEYLLSKSKGEGANSYFRRWKKIMHYAVKKDILREFPCEGIVCGVAEETIKKDILSQEEIGQLLSVTYPKQNMEIRRAFTLSLYVGLRYCDVKELTYENIDYGNRLLTFCQDKTRGHSRSATVTIPLNEGLLTLIGKPKQSPTEHVFDLPSHTACLKGLRYWVKVAGIPKHITWHCARHSFAVNILTNGANIKVVSELLGHSSLKHTEKYVRAVDAAKQAAINSLPELPEIK